jgi:peptidyl-prolyl cis-trans isomerase C
MTTRVLLAAPHRRFAAALRSRGAVRAGAIGAGVALLCAAVAVTHAEPAQKPAAAPPKAAARPKAPGQAAPAAKDPNADPAQQKRRAQALVTYKGGQVTVGEVEDAVARQSPFMRTRYRDPATIQELVDKTLRFALMGDEADRRGYGKSASVQQAVKQNAVQQLMKAEFDDRASAAAVPAADVEAYYKAHLDEYVQPQLQRVSHVMLSSEAEAKQVLEQAKSMDLREFRQLARDKSIDDVTKMRGGDLRYFDSHGKVRGGEQDASVPQPIATAAFALKNTGDTAPKVIKIDGGYSVVKLTGSRPAVSRKLSEVEDTIRVRLWRDQRQQAIDAFAAKLQDQYKPEVHADLIGAIKLEDGPPSNADLQPQQ